MFCTNCGTQLPEDAEFCTNCGKKLQGAAGAEVSKPQTSAIRNKITKPLIIAALFLCVIAAVWYSKSDVRQNLLMDTGVKAVSEQNFAKALNCYQKLYKLDNQSEELYLFGADIYLAQDRWEEAIRIIEEGIVVTGSERLKNRLGYICENVVVVSVVRTWEDGELELEFEYDEWGNLVNVYQKYSDEEVPVGIKLEHDNKGNLTKKIYYTDKNSDGVADTWEYDGACEEFEDDNKGNVISWKDVAKHVGVEANGMTYEEYFESWGEYEYDRHGNRIKDTEGHEDGSVSYVREYDSYGNEIKEIYYDRDGSVVWWYEYEYDNRGNQIKFISYDAVGSIVSSQEYEYDSRGNQIKYVHYDGDGSIVSLQEYEYDSRGNQIKYVHYDGDGSIVSSHEYEYDSHGNPIKTIDYNGDGSIRSWEECEYDSRGNQIKSINYDGDGSITWWKECEYDSRGYEIKSKYYNENGKVTSMSERELNVAGFSVKENDYYVWNEDGEEKESFSEVTWEYQFTYAGDILCCSNITPLSGVIKFVQDIPAGSGNTGDYDDYGVYLIMKRKPSNQSPYSYAVYFEILNEGIGKYYDVVRKNMLADGDETEWEVIGETAGFYQLENGWYVEKTHLGIIFTKL